MGISRLIKRKGFVNDSQEYPAYTEIIATSTVKGDVPEARLVQEFESYKEKIKAMFWQGETNYFVDGAELISE